jgi:hypothetical protein
MRGSSFCRHLRRRQHKLSLLRISANTDFFEIIVDVGFFTNYRLSLGIGGTVMAHSPAKTGAAK